MDQLITQLIAGLKQLQADFAEYKDIASRKEAAQADLKSTNAQLELANSKLESATAGITQAQIAAQKTHDEDIYRKQQIIQRLQEKIDSAKASHDEISAQVTSKQALHDSLTSGIASLRAKLS